MHVARSIHGLVVLDGGERRTFYRFVGQVEVDPVDPLDGIAVVADVVHPVILARGVVHDHDVVLRRIIRGGNLRIEFERRIVFGNDRARTVAETPLKLRRGLSQAEGEHAVDIGQRSLLTLLHEGRTRLSFGRSDRLAQPVSLGTQLFVDKRHHLGRIFRMGRLGHRLRRHHPVLAGYVVVKVPHSAVVQRRGEVVHHLAVIHRLGSRRGHILEKQVGLLENIPKVEVVVREVEIVESVFLHHRRPEHIHRGEHPAAPRLLLVGDSLHIHPIFEVVIDLSVELVIQRQGAYVAVGGQHVLDSHHGGIAVETLAHPRHILSGDGLCVGGDAAGDHEGGRQ